MTLTENEIIVMNSYKEKVKANTRKLAFNDLKEMQKPHSKLIQLNIQGSRLSLI